MPVASLLAGIAGALALRVVMIRDAVPPAPQGLAFGGLLLAFAVVAGSRLAPVRLSHVGLGATGGAVLILVPLLLDVLGHGRATGPVLFTNAGLSAPTWAVVTVVVACGEEALLRGALFRASLRPFGVVGTVLLTSVVFALIHLPFYGWGAMPLDLAVGIWLGGLRVATNSAVAPAIAHSLADLATWWL